MAPEPQEVLGGKETAQMLAATSDPYVILQTKQDGP
jgi:hypothetical protein